MTNVLANLYALLSVLPFITFILVRIIFVYVYQNKKKATRTSMDVTVFFLIGSVAVLSGKVFHSQWLFWIVIFLLLVLIGFVGKAQYQLKEEVDAKKIIKIALRFGFLLLSAVYIILFIIGITLEISKSM